MDDFLTIDQLLAEVKTKNPQISSNTTDNCSKDLTEVYKRVDIKILKYFSLASNLLDKNNNSDSKNLLDQSQLNDFNSKEIFKSLKSSEQLLKISSSSEIHSQNLIHPTDELKVQKNNKNIQHLQKKQVKAQVLQWYKNHQQKLLKLKDYNIDQTNEFLLEILQILMLSVWLAFDRKIPRYTQMISLWMNIHSKKIILQIKTGQGKTMIVAMTALYFALRGKKVDVFTSSSALALTQAKSTTSVGKIFSLFDISLGTNCEPSVIDRSIVYKNQVIYGTSFEFQADYLQMMFSGNKQIFKDRNFDQNHVAILDEVDALLIDRMRDSTRLSSHKPLFQAIKAIFILIHSVKKELTKAKLSFCGQLTVKILGNQIKINHVNQNISNKTSEEDLLKADQIEVISIVKAALKTQFNYLIPNYLLKEGGYIDIMLKIWVQNCYQIHKYEKDVHFIIVNQEKKQNLKAQDGNQKQKNKDKQKKTDAIIPVDLSTGTYLEKTKWSNGVHQFLELQQGFEPSVDSIVTNYESNLIYFTRYKHYLYGMTGTICESIGKKQVPQKSKFEQFLSETYGVRICKMPTAKTRLLKIQYPKIFVDYQIWLKTIYLNSKQYSRKRKVLIIFQHIKLAKTYIDRFSHQLTTEGYQIVNLYDNKTYDEALQSIAQTEKVIIVSTNLGGRGTDIQIKNQSILENGGLYVMMTYFAQNWRIQEQAFGRAGRNGQPGSGSFYIYIGPQSSQDKSQRQIIQNWSHQDKASCILTFQQRCKHRKKVEEFVFDKSKIARSNEQKKKDLLDKFHKRYLEKQLDRINELDKIIKKNNGLINKCKAQFIEKYKLQMEKDAADQQWGIFLKKNLPQNENQTQINLQFEKFEKQYNQNWRSNDINPGFFLNCGTKLINIDEGQAQRMFDYAFEKNPNSWVNLYYKTYFLLKQNSGRQLSVKNANALTTALRALANSMVIDYLIQTVMQSEGNMTESRKKQLEGLKKFFLSEMTNIQSIALTIEKYIVQNKERMKISSRLKSLSQSHKNLQNKMFKHSIKVDFQRIVEKKKKQVFGKAYLNLLAV